MAHPTVPHRTILAAALLASGLLLVFDQTYRTVAARVSNPAPRTPLNPAVLERFPHQLGDWVGQDIPLKPETRERTGADVIINRQYSHWYRPESVGLYVASGIAVRDLMGHRPEVCFISAGWTLMEHRLVELPLPGGTKLPCTMFQFSRGMLDAARMTVLHYYIVDGQYCGDVSRLRRKVWRGSDMVNYASQVRITVSGETSTTEAALRVASAFAVDSAPLLVGLFQESDEGPRTDAFPLIPGEK
jgi:hypothetical protein